MTTTRWLVLAIFCGASTLAGCGDKDEEDTAVGDTDTDTDTDTTDPAGSFQAVAEGLPSTLMSVLGTSFDDVWVVGADDGSGPYVGHFDGSEWDRKQNTLSGNLWWGWDDGQGTVWLSGEGAQVARYDVAAETFTSEAIADSTFTLFGIWGSSPTDVYAVAADVGNTRPGEILHYDGTSWTSVYTLPDAPNGSKRQPFKVWGSGPDDVWFVGTNAALTHWDGSTFTDMTAPINATITLFTVHGRGPDDVYAVGGQGNGAVIHWDGTAWTDDSPPPTAIAPGFNGVYVHPTAAPVAVGKSGGIWVRGDDGWAADPRVPSTTWEFHATYVDPDAGIWAVGGDMINLDHGVISYGGDGSVPSAEGT